MRVHLPRFKVASVLGIALICASCVTSERVVHHHERRPVLYGWHDDGGDGKLTIRISLPDQIAEFQRGGREIGWSYVATGKEGHGTRPGTYRIMEKIEDKYSNRYGWIEDEFGNVVDGDARVSDKVPPGMRYVPAPMPFWMRLTSYGIGMHGGLIPEPGKPASHGCIRLPKEFVPILYDSVEVGTQVTITNAPSKHGPRDPHETPLPSDWYPGSSPLAGPRPLNPAERLAYDPSGGALEVP